MEEPDPKVIVCVPAYNAADFIVQTLQSLKNQDYSNFKVLISDDCSTDNTVPVIQSYIKNDERFTLIQQKENLGWVDNVNFLMEKAVRMGEYTFILPHDDQIVFDYIQKLAFSLEEHSSAVLSFGDMECISANGRDVRICSNLDRVDNKIDRLKILLQRERWWWTAYRGMMRTEAVKIILPLQKNIFGLKEYSMDWIWLIKLSLQGEFVRVPEVIYTKYFRENNLSYKLRFTFWNYFGNLVTGSLVLWRSSLTTSEQFSLQSTIFILIVKHLVIASGLYSAWMRLKTMDTDRVDERK